VCALFLIISCLISETNLLNSSLKVIIDMLKIIISEKCLEVHETLKVLNEGRETSGLAPQKESGIWI